MAKKPSDALAKTEEAGALAVPGAEAFFAEPVMPNADASDRMIPVLHLFQATSQEQEKLGTFKLGDLVDAVERRVVASRRIAVIKGQKRYVRWEKGEAAPVYVYSNKADVTPADLEWGGDKGNRTPPLATEIMEFYVAVEGEPWPYLLRMKRTSLKAGRMLYELCERARMQRRIGLYELGFVKENGEKGVYAVFDVRQVGDAPQDMAGLVVNAHRSLSTGTVKVDEGALGGAAVVEDNIPI